MMTREDGAVVDKAAGKIAANPWLILLIVVASGGGYEIFDRVNPSPKASVQNAVQLGNEPLRLEVKDLAEQVVELAEQTRATATAHEILYQRVDMTDAQIQQRLDKLEAECKKIQDRSAYRIAFEKEFQRRIEILEAKGGR